MKPTENQALKIPFHGDTLYLVDHKGEPYTPMKPIVEAMGLDWKSQYRRISGNSERWGMVFMTMVAQDKKQREMVCMPVRKLFGWMMTVSPNRVKPEIKDKVIQYQNECDDILWEHWSSKHNLIGGLEPQVADQIVSINHLETICEHRRSSAAILYFFLKNENTDLAENRWFKMSYRKLEQHTGFAHTGIGIALKYLCNSELLFWDSENSSKYYYQINHKILNQKLRQHGLPKITKILH